MRKLAKSVSLKCLGNYLKSLIYFQCVTVCEDILQEVYLCQLGTVKAVKDTEAFSDLSYSRMKTLRMQLRMQALRQRFYLNLVLLEQSHMDPWWGNSQ